MDRDDPLSEFAVTMRTAVPADADAISAVLRSSFPAAMAPFYDADQLELALPGMIGANPVLLRSGSYFVAELGDGSIVAVGGWTRERPGSGEMRPGLAHLRHFATHGDWIGRGLGQRVYDHCERTARAVGISRFECFASLNAKTFYRGLGFTTVERVDIVLGNGVTMPSLHMQRSLQNVSSRLQPRT